jgi:hypothetical protein
VIWIEVHKHRIGSEQKSIIKISGPDMKFYESALKNIWSLSGLVNGDADADSAGTRESCFGDGTSWVGDEETVLGGRD